MVAFAGITSKLTNLGNSAVGGVGGALQGVNTVASNATLQKNILSGTGDSLSVDAQAKASKESDANGAKLIAMQAQETMKKQTMDVLNAIQAGKEDSTNKKISATATNAKGISY
ncbi:HrpA pilus formation protein [Pseudomonas syringae]|uniref:Type III helper protein HrpA1 n=1 Tax=Pseudomonas syringae pv. apii TaxID=81036 RepID=A0A3M3RHG2_9PSED|nr:MULTISPECIES: Hrp pili protein HrpA [Pseudomonas syringae group]RMN42775.1 Type III helper protein HrpA1 [Pseudomonas syringae pv. apii]RMN47692.1 Type III helper protein HrpA1 [Pseudomonas syringae pv. apii]RMN95581.1 Type III helper protein HrpA1 [Pseudomonas syringae pv. apii]SDY27940.1 HrpA pilus formation protein [Pseudomonas syringae]